MGMESLGVGCDGGWGKGYSQERHVLACSSSSSSSARLRVTGALED